MSFFGAFFGASEDFPDESDVRSGVVYKDGQLTGTLELTAAISSNTYATAADLLCRKDERDIRDLVSDDGQAVAAADLTDSGTTGGERVLCALQDAAGDVESALAFGTRFTPDTLADLTGNAAARLKRMVCEIAIYYLIMRRPDTNSESLKYYSELRETHLEPLRKGQNVFAIPENEPAGQVSVDGPSIAEYDALSMTRDETKNYYPARRPRRF